VNVYGNNSRAASIQTWTVTISCIFVSLSGVILSLICIFALPDKSTQPIIGIVCFTASALLLIALVLMLGNRTGKSHISQISEGASEGSVSVIYKETTSDKVLKWIVTLFSLFFAYCGVLFGLICIYSLPDKTVRPALGAVYFLGAILLVSTFIYVVWKKR